MAKITNKNSGGNTMAKKTRPLISKPFDLKDYLPEFTTYEYKVYLSYIYQLDSYMLITNRDGAIFFKPLEIKCNPNKFYTDYDKQENYEGLVIELTKIIKPYTDNLKENGLLKHEIRDKKENLVLTIIDTLTEHLSDLYDNEHFTKVGNYPEKSIKDFIFNPVDIYNLHLNVDPEEIEIRVEDAVTKITDTIKELIHLYNENRTFMNITHKREVNRAIKFFIDSTTADPFLNLHLGYSPVKYYHAQAGESIVKEFGLKRHLKNNDNDQLYFYDNDLKYFDEITTQQLKKKLYKSLGFNLTENDINTVTKAVPTEDIQYNNLLVFRNMYFDTDTLREFKPLPEVTTYNRKDYLTVFNIGTLNQKDNTINLLDYNKELTIDEVLTVKGIKTTDEERNQKIELPKINPKISVNEYKKRYGMTLTELVLRQLLIPKDNPTDIRLFKDYLERLGSNIYGANLYKVITFYYGDGDNGKSILNLFNNLIFNKLNYEIKPEALAETFSLESFYNRLLITIDEITRSSFDDLKDYLKQISSKYSKMEKRQIYSNKTFIIYGFPNITIYSNELLDLNPEKDGALFSRLDYLKLPNKFLDSKELIQYPNSYPLVNGLEDLLSKDTEGLSWLITAGILCFKQMKETSDKYTLKQTREETIDIYSNMDYLSKFLMLYTEYVDDLPREFYISNTDITNSYLQYMANLNKTVDTDGLSKEIGIKLRQKYPELKQKENKYKETGTGRTMYKLKLKEPEDITREFNEAYTINEFATDRQLSILDMDGKLKTVYNSIQKGNCTISILEIKLPNINCIEIVKQLESLDLIYKTGNTVLPIWFK